MSNLNDRRNSPRRRIDDVFLLVMLRLLCFIHSAAYTFAFVITGEWFLLCFALAALKITVGTFRENKR